MSIPTKQDAMKLLDIFDPEIADLLYHEEKRQFEILSLVISESVVSPLASYLEGSAFINKSTEGYPGKRFVDGCQLSGQAGILTIERVRKAFGTEHTNIQSGNATITNMAALTGLLNPGDTFLGLTLDNGEHLSHDAKFHYNGRSFSALHYGVDRKTGMVDVDQIRQMALENKPKLIVTSASSCPHAIDYKAFRKVCDEVGTYLQIDCAHDCGLVAGGAIPSPVPYADVATMSAQKTLRGPRGCGVVPCGEELTAKLNCGVFPRLQGGPGGDILAARGVLFLKLLQPEFKTYAHQVCAGVRALTQGCQEEGMRVITGGTDAHVVVLDVTPVIANDREAEDLLSSIGITANKNMIPYDTFPPSLGSDLHIGSPTMTTRGAKEEKTKHIGHLLGYTLSNKNNPVVLTKIKEEIYKVAISHSMFSSEQVSPSIREESEAVYYNR